MLPEPQEQPPKNRADRIVRAMCIVGSGFVLSLAVMFGWLANFRMSWFRDLSKTWFGWLIIPGSIFALTILYAIFDWWWTGRKKNDDESQTPK